MSQVTTATYVAGIVVLLYVGLVGLWTVVSFLWLDRRGRDWREW